MDVKKIAIYLIAILLIFGSGFWVRGYLYDNEATIARMEAALGEAGAINQRLTAERDKLQQLNTGLTEENNRITKYSQDLAANGEALAGQLSEVWDYVARIERNNRENETGLTESAEINKRTRNLISEVEKTGK